MQSSSYHARRLRTGRHSQVGQYYFLTTCVAGRKTVFADADNAKVVLNAIRWLDLVDRFQVDAAVVMPDHLHIAGVLRSSSLSDIMRSLKRFTARRLADRGVQSPVWQRGYHDHALRADEEYATRLNYLIENPVRAGLVNNPQDYPFLIVKPGLLELP